MCCFRCAIFTLQPFLLQIRVAGAGGVASSEKPPERGVVGVCLRGKRWWFRGIVAGNNHRRSRRRRCWFAPPCLSPELFLSLASSLSLRLSVPSPCV
ncbi:hypothetical protein HanXRQr2_Chr12g0557561 [Helianthus annuus]|uniref:Secreted protein n=1 Tax=Helianthus annuus TaxID=4232 RepID=A0A9K3MXE2_HELAN|nr:hypothetical protein HanXRQr2_Chr12g0557561 [Helianthus annuus]